MDDLLKQIDAKRRKQPKEEQEGDEDGDEAPVCDIVWCSEKQKVLVLKFKQWLRCGMQQGTRPPILLWSTQNRCLERCRTRRRGIRICRRLVQTQLLTTNNKHQINLAPMHTKPLSCGFLQTQDEGDGATDDANAVEPGPGPNGAGNDEQAEQGVSTRATPLPNGSERAATLCLRAAQCPSGCRNDLQCRLSVRSFMWCTHRRCYLISKFVWVPGKCFKERCSEG